MEATGPICAGASHLSTFKGRQGAGQTPLCNCKQLAGGYLFHLGEEIKKLALADVAVEVANV